MPETFLQDEARWILIGHALSAVVVTAASVHAAVVSIRLAQGRAAVLRLARVYALVIGAAYPLTFATGLLAYPSFRYWVRGLFLDRYEPWASNLFDFKENLAALGLPFALALFFIGRRLRAMPDRATALFFAVASVSLAALCIVAAVSGLVVTSVKGP